MSKSGDQCPECNLSRLYISKSVPTSDRLSQIQTLRCRTCKHTSQHVARAGEVRRRKVDYLIP